MTKQAQQGFTAESVLSGALEKLLAKFPSQKMEFPEYPPSPVVGEDHPDRYGCMIYRNAAICKINGNDWILAQGENDGYYLTDNYRADILALNLPVPEEGKDLCNAVKGEIEGSYYFRNSMILALSDGNLGVIPATRFEKRMKELVARKVSDFILQMPEYDQRYILASTLNHPTTRRMLYKQELIDFLATTIEGILSNPPPKRRFYL